LWSSAERTGSPLAATPDTVSALDPHLPIGSCPDLGLELSKDGEFLLDLLANCSPAFLESTDPRRFMDSKPIGGHLESGAFSPGLVGTSSEGLEPVQRNGLSLGDARLTNMSSVAADLVTVKLEPQPEPEALSAFSLDAQEEVVVGYSPENDSNLSIPKLLSPLSSCQSDSGYESTASPASPFDLSGHWPSLSESGDIVDDIIPPLSDPMDSEDDMDTTINQLFPDLF